MFTGKKAGFVVMGLLSLWACRKSNEMTGVSSPRIGPTIWAIESFADNLLVWVDTEGSEKHLPTSETLRIHVQVAWLDYNDDGTPCYYPSTFLEPDNELLKSIYENKGIYSFYDNLSAKAKQSIVDAHKNNEGARFNSFVPYAGISGVPVITADKKLFGHPAGEVLTDYFSVVQMDNASQYIFTYPDLQLKAYYGKEKLSAPVPIKDFYTEGVSLPFGCQIIFSQKPKEPWEVPYHYLTLKIQIPVKALSTFSFGDNFDEGKNPEVETVLVGEVTIDFDRFQ